LLGTNENKKFHSTGLVIKNARKKQSFKWWNAEATENRQICQQLCVQFQPFFGKVNQQVFTCVVDLLAHLVREKNSDVTYCWMVGKLKHDKSNSGNVSDTM
jgi:hypothetical protein